MDQPEQSSAGESRLPGATGKELPARRRAWKAPELIRMDVVESTRGGGVPQPTETIDYLQS